MTGMVLVQVKEKREQEAKYDVWNFHLVFGTPPEEILEDEWNRLEDDIRSVVTNYRDTAVMQLDTFAAGKKKITTQVADMKSTGGEHIQLWYKHASHLELFPCNWTFEFVLQDSSFFFLSMSPDLGPESIAKFQFLC